MITAPLSKMCPRGDDPTGAGWYGAKRGAKKHKGFDLEAKPGALVKCPIDGVISKIGYAYAKAPQFRYIEITSEIYRIRVFYVEPKIGLAKGDRVFAGKLIGKAQDIAGYWNPKMINHIHIEVYKNGLLTDPEPLLFS